MMNWVKMLRILILLILVILTQKSMKFKRKLVIMIVLNIMLITAREFDNFTARLKQANLIKKRFCKLRPILTIN